MDQWVPPADSRSIPSAPRMLTAPEDIDKLATLLARAKNPVVLTEAAGRETETFEALVELCELLALPVVEKPAALFANFPKDHPLHQGHDLKPMWNDIDLAIVIRTRVPWYPPSRSPPNAVIAVVDETPHREAMVYQSHHADMYLEGNVAQTLRDLAAAMRTRGLDAAAIEAKRKRLAAFHEQLMTRRQARQAEARNKRPIDPVWLCSALGEAMPRGTIYIDEVTTHTNIIREHVRWNDPQSLFTRQGGLGQGLGLALGVKLAKPERPVVALIGDGALLYNPTLGALGAARDYRLPILAVVFNNKKYAAMQQMHLKMYPEGTAVHTETFHGTHIRAPDFAKVAEAFGAYAERVEDPEALPAALRRGLEATNKGTAAILDVAVG